MIVAQYKSPYVVYQTADTEMNVPEPAIAISTDASGLVIINQEGREVVLNRASIRDLIRAINLALKAEA